VEVRISVEDVLKALGFLAKYEDITIPHNLQTTADSKQELEGSGVPNHSHYSKAYLLSAIHRGRRLDFFCLRKASSSSSSFFLMIKSSQIQQRLGVKSLPLSASEVSDSSPESCRDGSLQNIST